MAVDEAHECCAGSDDGGLIATRSSCGSPGLFEGVLKVPLPAKASQMAIVGQSLPSPSAVLPIAVDLQPRQPPLVLRV
jgi:hypothetical protein